MVDAQGELAWSAEMGVWGRMRGLVGDARCCPFRWPGQYEDAETGLYYNRFRYYEPESGQYVSQDPIRLIGGTAVYAYPREISSQTDPLGLACNDIQQRREDDRPQLLFAIRIVSRPSTFPIWRTASISASQYRSSD